MELAFDEMEKEEQKQRTEREVEDEEWITEFEVELDIWWNVKELGIW
jgi:hypothetical protein